jgi:hypothetical protein
MEIPEKYYTTLELTSSATAEQVKKAYRRLAMKYHPDRTSEPGAVDRFLEVTEAYEIITGQRPLPKRGFSTKTTAQTPASSEEEKQREYDERIKKARMRFQQRKQDEKLKEEAFFTSILSGKLYRFFCWIVWISCITSLLIIADTFIVGKTEEQSIVSINAEVKGGMMYDLVFEAVLDRDEVVWLDLDLILILNESQEITIERSRVFNEIKNISFYHRGSQMETKPDFTLMGTFPLVPLLFLIPFITYLLKSKRMVYVFLFLCSTYILPIGIVIFYIVNNHWLKLFSFQWLL